MSGFIGVPNMSDIQRLDAELDRIRWYLGQLGGSLEGIDAALIVRALKTGNASVEALRGETA